MSARLIVWKNNGTQIDFITVDTDEKAIEFTTRKCLLDMLTNKPNDTLQKDWSTFGKVGDCIKII